MNHGLRSLDIDWPEGWPRHQWTLIVKVDVFEFPNKSSPCENDFSKEPSDFMYYLGWSYHGLWSGQLVIIIIIRSEYRSPSVFYKLQNSLWTWRNLVIWILLFEVKKFCSRNINSLTVSLSHVVGICSQFRLLQSLQKSDSRLILIWLLNYYFCLLPRICTYIFLLPLAVAMFLLSSAT